VPISHHFHDCKAPLARASHVKWRYTKYLGFSFSFLAFYYKTLNFTRLIKAFSVDRFVPNLTIQLAKHNQL